MTRLLTGPASQRRITAGKRRGRRNKPRGRHRRLASERLEERLPLAAVLWDGGGDSLSWHDPLNWSGDQLPSASDDVTIETSDLCITHGSGTTEIRSLASNAAINLTGGSLTVKGPSIVHNAFTVSGGATLSAEGQNARFTAGSAMLRNANLASRDGGVLDFPNLHSLTDGKLTLDGAGRLDAPNLMNIDNSRLFLSGGAQLSVLATSYSATGLAYGTTLFSVA